LFKRCTQPGWFALASNVLDTAPPFKLKRTPVPLLGLCPRVNAALGTVPRAAWDRGENNGCACDTAGHNSRADGSSAFANPKLLSCKRHAKRTSI
jgi:hypothetical protein